MKYLYVGIVLLAILFVTDAHAVSYEDRPAFTNGQFYVFTDAATATNALNAINASGWFPLPGRNAKTGEVSGQATTSWFSEVLQTADGKFVFPRIPDALLAKLGVPAAQKSAWWDAFLPDVEEYQSSWFPEE